MENKVTIGERIRSLRETKDLSISQVAENAGLESDQIRHIEENQDVPSIAVLIKIARSMGVRLGSFMDDHEELGPVVSRKDDQKDANIMHCGQSSCRHMNYHALSQSKAGRHMETFQIRIEPCGHSDFVLSSHEGEEFVYVLDGEIEIKYGSKTYLLKQGDSIYYDSIVPHHVHSANGMEADVLAVIYTPF
ncbi:MAG: helix-turn-helix domain-containing protein [Bacteroidales bacterium]